MFDPDDWAIAMFCRLQLIITWRLGTLGIRGAVDMRQTRR